MKTISPPGGDAASRDVLDAAMKHYERTVRALQDIIDELQAGELARAKDAKGALQDLGRATQTALDERSRVDKRLRSETTAAGGYALDFDAARDEIGRRLARLRAAGGTGGVPE